MMGKQDEDLAFFHLEETTSTMDAIRDTLASEQVKKKQAFGSLCV
jgi:hypothetical protein